MEDTKKGKEYPKVIREIAQELNPLIADDMRRTIRACQLSLEAACGLLEEADGQLVEINNALWNIRAVIGALHYELKEEK